MSATKSISRALRRWRKRLVKGNNVVRHALLRALHRRLPRGAGTLVMAFQTDEALPTIVDMERPVLDRTLATAFDEGVAL